MGQLVPDTTVVTSSTYIGCRGRRPCLDNCSYSLANRKLVHNSVTFTVAGITDRTCTASRAQSGGTLTTTITQSGFAAANGAYYVPMEDSCWPFNTTLSWSLYPTVRYQTALVGGSSPFSFDVTCTMQINVSVARDAFVGLTFAVSCVPFSPAASGVIWDGGYSANWKCRLNAGAVDSSSLTNFCGEYLDCYRDLPRGSLNVTQVLAVNLFACCPFSGITVTPAWSTV